MSNLLTSKIGTALVLRFNRPERRNPLSLEVLDEIEAILSSDLAGVSRIVFTGTGNVFASGANLREIASLDAAAAEKFARRGQRLMSQIEALDQQTVAAVNGPCYGGALDLALACDMRIALPMATFCHPGAGLGIITGWGGTQRLPRLIGRANALEMFFTASPIDSARALQIGLVHALADEPVAAAMEISGND